MSIAHHLRFFFLSRIRRRDHRDHSAHPLVDKLDYSSLDIFDFVTTPTSNFLFCELEPILNLIEQQSCR